MLSQFFSTTFVSVYLEDFLLGVYIPFIVLIAGFFRSKERFFTDFLYQKMVFSTILKLTTLIVFLCGLRLVTQLLLFDTVALTASFESFFNTTDLFFVTGNFFFKKDFLILVFQLILTVLVLLYLVALHVFFKNTNTSFKYSLEIPVLIATIYFGLKIFLMSYDLIIIILTLELVSFCTVILIGLQNTQTSQNIFPLEAAIKYFVFNAIAVAFMLVALSGYYGLLGDLNLNTLINYYLFFPVDYFLNWEAFFFLHLFFFCAYLMKLGVAPFHQWVPDVYEGSELLLTAFLVLIIAPALNFKFFIFLKIFFPFFEINNFLFSLFLICGVISIFIGTFNAFLQTRLKRFLAYSGIVHLGYMLIGIGTGSYFGIFASFFYLILYIGMNLLFFGILLFVKSLSQLNLIYLNQLKSLFTSHFLIFFLFAVPLFSYAGFPPFGGFFSKLVILISLLESHYYILGFILIVYIVINAYLYLRFFKIAVFEKKQGHFFFPLMPITLPEETTLDSSGVNVKMNSVLSFQLWHSLHSKIFMYLFFLLNVLLFLFVLFLPLVGLFLQQQLFVLFLFY